MSVPSSRMLPLSAVSWPVIHRRRVDFPAPEGPMTETNCPASTEKLTPSRAAVKPP